MKGIKIKLERDFLQNNMGFQYRELDLIGDVYGIILDKFSGLNKYDTLENCSHSSNYIYLTTDYYLIKLLESNYQIFNDKINRYGNVWMIKPNQIKRIIE